MTFPESNHLDADLPIQPCYTNPEVIHTITTNMAAQIRQTPDIEIFLDPAARRCQQLVPVSVLPRAERHTSRCYCAGAGQAHCTDLPIELIAYGNTDRARELPVSNRIVTMLCPCQRPMSGVSTSWADAPRHEHGLSEPDRLNPVDDRDYGKLFRAWAPVWKANETVPRICEYGGILWHDETFRTERQRFLCHPPAELRFDEVKWYRDHGVRYFSHETEFMNWPDASLQLAMARSLWNADEEPEAYLDRYYGAACGSLGRAVRLALERIEKSLTAREDPASALARLERILPWLPDSATRARYQSWVGYVRLAWKGEAFLDGRYEGLWSTRRPWPPICRSASPGCWTNVNMQWVMSYSETRQARLRQIISDGGLPGSRE